jgi:hypothetical protein
MDTTPAFPAYKYNKSHSCAFFLFSSLFLLSVARALSYSTQTLEPKTMLRSHESCRDHVMIRVTGKSPTGAVLVLVTAPKCCSIKVHYSARNSRSNKLCPTTTSYLALPLRPFHPTQAIISVNLAGSRVSWPGCNKGPRPSNPGPANTSVATDNRFPSCGEPR